MENNSNPNKDGKKTKKRYSLNAKISIAMIGVVLFTLLGVCAIVFSAMGTLMTKLLDSSQKIGNAAAEDSYSSMYEMTRTRLMELAAGRADLADTIFQDFEKSVIILAETAERLYDRFRTRPMTGSSRCSCCIPRRRIPRIRPSSRRRG